MLSASLNKTFLFILGQVLTRKNIEDIINFAKEENLFLLADEVCLIVCVCVHVCFY